MVQSREVVGGNRAAALPSIDTRFTRTLTSRLVTILVLGTTSITVTGLAAECIVNLKIVCAIDTLVTTSTVDEWSTNTLTILDITHSTPSHGPTDIASAVFASIRVGWPQVPVRWFARVANSSTDAVFALTQLSVAV